MHKVLCWLGLHGWRYKKQGVRDFRSCIYCGKFERVG